MGNVYKITDLGTTDLLTLLNLDLQKYYISVSIRDDPNRTFIIPELCHDTV